MTYNCPIPYTLPHKHNTIAGKSASTIKKVFNYKYRHFVPENKEDVIGLSIDELISRWGDYTFALVDDPYYDGHMYSFAHIMLPDDGAYFNGVTVCVDNDGKVIEIEPMRERHRNLFGSLPFYESILRLNLMEWVRPGPWLESVGDAPSRGFWMSLILSLVYFVLLLAGPLGIAFLLYTAFDQFGGPRFQLPAAIVLIPLTYIVEYVIIISIPDYYSAAWWVTSLIMVGWCAIAPWMIIGATSHYCPECKGKEWDEERNIFKVEYPKTEFKQVWTASGHRVVLSDPWQQFAQL